MAEHLVVDEPLRRRELITEGPEQTIAVGRRLGMLLEAGDLVALQGSFGAGKTHLVKGIASGLGIDQADVTSPTFVLINQYQAGRAGAGFPIFHVDLYRLEQSEEFYSIGLEECWEGHGLCLIEWAERAEPLLPHERLDVKLEHLGEDRRSIRLEARGARYAQLLERLGEG